MNVSSEKESTNLSGLNSEFQGFFWIFFHLVGLGGLFSAKVFIFTLPYF
jgi:hypothetical protein